MKARGDDLVFNRNRNLWYYRYIRTRACNRLLCPELSELAIIISLASFSAVVIVVVVAEARVSRGAAESNYQVSLVLSKLPA